ncbi:hypothetical protein BJV78DRAFT_1198380 [Lactifluus subvellereus]|nr:hypothetical protein BJV78DRAFT_1198380 [Lactifluus subvellereus]
MSCFLLPALSFSLPLLCFSLAFLRFRLLTLGFSLSHLGRSFCLTRLCPKAGSSPLISGNRESPLLLCRRCVLKSLTARREWRLEPHEATR